MWLPTGQDVAWMRNLLGALKHQGVWGTTNGIYTVDQQQHLLTLHRSDTFDQSLHDQIVVCCARLGYRVVLGDDQTRRREEQGKR